MLPPILAFLPVRSFRRAFTLVEMLVVMAVVVVLIGICTPVIISLKGAGDVTKTVYDLAGVLEQSRAYAMGNNTYVYVGLEEMNVTGSGTPAVGRLVAVAVAVKDGTQGFSSGSTANPASWTSAYPAFARGLAPVGKPFVFDNIHMPDLGPPPTASGMARPVPGTTGTSSYSLGNSQCVSATPFDYPLGAALDAGQYSFKKVIQFDPQGVARFQFTGSPAVITTYMEVGLQQTHGAGYVTLPASPTTGEVAAIQVDGMTGAVRVYRP